jgi:hypothetical protein
LFFDRRISPETIMNNQRPVFQPFTIDLMQLCNGNMDQQVFFTPIVVCVCVCVKQSRLLS